MKNQTDAQGRKQGLWEELHENGNISWRENWCNDELHGLAEVFRDNGNICWRANFRNGKKHGLEELFREDGQLEFKNIY